MGVLVVYETYLNIGNKNKNLFSRMNFKSTNCPRPSFQPGGDGQLERRKLTHTEVKRGKERENLWVLIHALSFPRVHLPPFFSALVT